MATIGTPPDRISYSRELEHFLVRSKLINSYYEKDFDISFSSLFLAFLANDDTFSKWFQTYAKQAGIDVQGIMEERGINQQIMSEIANSEPFSGRSYKMTISAQKYLQTADQFRRSLAQKVKLRPLGVRHLMAVFIYRPWVHERDIIRWGISREDWSNGFIERIGSLCPDELGFWLEQHRKSFGNDPEI